jgi:hypothetical protein
MSGSSVKGTDPAPARDKTGYDTLIAEVSYKKWVRAGRPQGQFDRFWEEAEREILQKAAEPIPVENAPPKG